MIVTKKRYGAADFGIVGLMVAGLGMFMHADAKTSAVFQPLGIIMLTISLLCDGAISNLSEALMNQYEVGQDEFIFRLTVLLHSLYALLPLPRAICVMDWHT